ncbi:MAG TPA: hypothetical protein VEA63_15245 [Opitutus sp.]|nr:hypothetical protein [Opitutus sp.]
MNSLEPDDTLARALADWRIRPPANPNFRPAVWQRLRQRTRETWSGYVRAHASAWVLIAALTLTASGWAGLSAGKAKLAAERDAMVTAYLVELDPRVQATLRPASP